MDVDHTYAFLKSGSSNRYLKYAEEWQGFYIGFENFPLDLLEHDFEHAATIHPALREKKLRGYFSPLREIYQTSTSSWRDKVRYALWNRASNELEVWQAVGELRPFPREFLPQLFDDCRSEAELPASKEWRRHLEFVSQHCKSDDLSDQCAFVASSSGCRFLPARRICAPTSSEDLYAPIDTLSVLQQLNRRTFAYMTEINPPAVPWPEGIFEGTTVFAGPAGPREESGYGRFVREYLDLIVEPDLNNSLASLSRDQRMRLVCATVNPLLVETAAMLFALDIGMVIDSGRGNGRQGIDVIAACPRESSPDQILERLSSLGISLPHAAAEHLRERRTLSFQCKGYDGMSANVAERFVEFRPFGSAAGSARGISLFEVLRLACHPDRTGLNHLNGWLDRMCEVVVPLRTTSNACLPAVPAPQPGSNRSP